MFRGRYYCYLSGRFFEEEEVRLSDSDGNIRDFVSFVKLCKAGGGIFRGGRRWKFAEE